MGRFRELEVFTRVVESGSFTAAAQALRLPKASATTHVQALEARLGVKLLHRTTRRVSLTREGALYYEEASRLLRELGELDASVGAAQSSARGRLRVDVPAASGRQVVGPALPRFFERHPHLSVELGSSDRLVDLAAEGVDCVIRGGDTHDQTLVSRKLGELPVINMASPAYLAARGTPRSPDELDGHVFVRFFSVKTGRLFEVDFEKDGRKLELQPAYLAASNDAETAISLALAGLGILQAPVGPELRRAVRDGRLVPVLTDWTCEPLPSWVLYPRTRALPARVRVFVDWVVELYREEMQNMAGFMASLR